MVYEYQYESGIKNIIHRHNLWVSDTDYKNAKESLNEVYRKAKAFDEVKQYALSKNKDFEDRKDTARSNKEFNYFNTLQIANRAIINKCKQLEDE
ncbi:hypothetical protein [Mammaliicoccus vitulinus]|uniref:hypothetical protein n=1 Tax=Mammaliicoccus vitulinus TaxID=71237 RepID=UPI00248C90A2|nr:hypothetical protein [Mammaliicoccus vitulinus]